MNPLIIYFILVLLLAAFGALVVVSFWRYRFVGDRTALVVTLFTVAFILLVGSTLFLIDPNNLTTQVSTLVE